MLMFLGNMLQIVADVSGELPWRGQQSRLGARHIRVQQGPVLLLWRADAAGKPGKTRGPMQAWPGRVCGRGLDCHS